MIAKNYHVSSSVGISRFPLYFLVNEKVQKQVGASGCGLFALAFAADLCHGLDPTNRSYDQAKIREHLIYQLPWGQNKYSFFKNHLESSLSHIC